MIRSVIILLLLFSIKFSFAQTPVQNVRGIVIDRNSRNALAGASISVVEAQNISTVSDTLGKFILRNIPTGRIKIKSTYVGYQSYITNDILLTAGKEQEIIIEMEDLQQEHEAVVIEIIRNPKLPVNRYSMVSGRSFSPEETQRFAASANDPSRMAMSFPGVQATRDTRSDIIIRGNNPLGMQWRLEGVDIVNPNHFARKGSSGGGITILSLSMFDNSDFLTGAMPAEYGDVLSGVFDMHLRKGNNQKNEYSFKAGMIGLDFAAEGPIKKGQSSFLANYRYSTLGLLNKIGLNLVGERENNTFQDFAFNLAFNNKKNTSQWNFWGIGGLSNEDVTAVKDTLQWKQYDDYAVYDFRTKVGAIGIGNTLKLNERSFLQSSMVIMGQQVSFVDDTLNKQQVPFTVNDELYNNNRISLTTSYNNKISASANVKAGLFINKIFYEFRQDEFDFTTNVYRYNVNSIGNTMLLQPYLQMSLKPGSKLTINPGVHIMHLALNKKTTIDPRLSVQYKFNPKQNISVAYGLHSKILPLGSYFLYNASSATYPNLNLDMIRSHHFIAAFDQMLGKGWRFHTEVYYQQLFNVPVVNDINRTYWLLNDLEGYAKEELVSKGKGTNKGVDISIEKIFNKGLFMIGSFSIFNSTYQPLNGKEYNTRFNSATTGSWIGAKEWNLKRNKVFQFGWKILYNGGLPLTPLAALPSNTREPVLDESRPFSERVPAYFRTDARFALRKDKTKRSWQLALDVQNIFAIKNTDGLSRRYDPSINQWIYRTQSGLVPILSYQVDF